jgi:hypothetical protein
MRRSLPIMQGDGARLFANHVIMGRELLSPNFRRGVSLPISRNKSFPRGIEREGQFT